MLSSCLVLSSIRPSEASGGGRTGLYERQPEQAEAFPTVGGNAGARRRQPSSFTCECRSAAAWETQPDGCGTRAVCPNNLTPLRSDPGVARAGPVPKPRVRPQPWLQHLCPEASASSCWSCRLVIGDPAPGVNTHPSLRPGASGTRDMTPNRDGVFWRDRRTYHFPRG